MKVVQAAGEVLLLGIPILSLDDDKLNTASHERRTGNQRRGKIHLNALPIWLMDSESINE